jgi:hypothetical protein
MQVLTAALQHAALGSQILFFGQTPMIAEKSRSGPSIS